MTYGPLPISIENPTTVANLEIYLHFFRKIGKSEIRLDGRCPPPPSSENTEIFCNSFLLEKYHQNNKSQQKSICKSTGLIQVRMAKNSIDHI